MWWCMDCRWQVWMHLEVEIVKVDALLQLNYSFINDDSDEESGDDSDNEVEDTDSE